MRLTTTKTPAGGSYLQVRLTPLAAELASPFGLHVRYALKKKSGPLANGAELPKLAPVSSSVVMTCKPYHNQVYSTLLVIRCAARKGAGFCNVAPFRWWNGGEKRRGFSRTAVPRSE
uniref:Uncharacterized protein n=1 Tax=Coccidioides posadasii RMSCC 3488 TaxID=454284 RepID=A0A0J6FJW4_COCPO|nr:hypothetical protein CPAG_05451 [Coccidioides posadasii RMSCC 3488]